MLEFLLMVIAGLALTAVILCVAIAIRIAQINHNIRVINTRILTIYNRIRNIQSMTFYGKPIDDSADPTIEEFINNYIKEAENDTE